LLRTSAGNAGVVVLHQEFKVSKNCKI